MPASSPAAGSGPASRTPALSRELLRHLPSGVIFFDAAGCVDDANPAARTALGRRNPIGLSFAELFGPAELIAPGGASLGGAAAQLTMASESGATLQRKILRYTAPDKTIRQLGVTFFPVPGPPRAGSICLLTDLTSIRALEEELQLRRNLSSLGEMAAGISHEFKNSLATISGYAQMLGAEVDSRARVKVDKILEQTAMLSNMASDFLTFARPLQLQPERLELGVLLRRCAESVWMQDFPQVVIALEGPFPAVTGDAVLLPALIRNLLRNACEAIVESRQGGQIVVRFGGYDAHRVRIEFLDDGPGVAPDMVEKIFIPFFTTKASGSGLGLAMAHKIAAAHDGSIRLTSSDPGHTIFELRLPADPATRPV